MTFPEYRYRMKAYNLSEVDKQHDMHLQAWINREVKMTEQKGSKTIYVYREFEDFFDYNKRLKEIEQEKKVSALTDKERFLAKTASKINSKGG